jgi:hypothetical protein
VTNRQLGLAARPEVDPEITAVVAAAVSQLLSGGAGPREVQRESTAWKFSGRWFAGHQVRTRLRPH